MTWPEMSARYDRMFEENVPPYGNADTRFGEVLRNASRLIKRYYNDGDMAHTKYGAESVDDQLSYLLHCGVDEIEATARRMDSLMDRYRGAVTRDQFQSSNRGYDDDDDDWDDEDDDIVPNRAEERYDELLNELAAEIEELCRRKGRDPYYLGPPVNYRAPKKTPAKQGTAKKVGRPVPNRGKRVPSNNAKTKASEPAGKRKISSKGGKRRETVSEIKRKRDYGPQEGDGLLPPLQAERPDLHEKGGGHRVSEQPRRRGGGHRPPVLDEEQ